MKKMMMILAAVLLASVAAQADLVGTWGHSTNYVTADQLLPVANISGAMDNQQAQPTNNYAGPVFYANMQGTATVLQGQVRNQGSFGNNGTDFMHLQSSTGTSVDEWAQFSMRQAAFETGFTTGAISLTNLTATMKRNGNGTASFQFMIQNNGSWYVSESSFSLTTSWAANSLNVADSNWALFDPTANLNPGSVTYSAMTFNQATAFGVLDNMVYSGASAGVQMFVDSVDAYGSVIPEPATLGLIGVVGIGLIGIRRFLMV